MAEAVSAPKELFLPAKRKLQDLYPEDGICIQLWHDFSHVFWMWPGQSLETSERWVDVFPISSSKGEAWKECQILAAATNTVNEKRWDINTQRRGTNQNKGILCWWLAPRCDHFGANKTKVTVGAKKEAQNLLAHYHCEICPTLSKTTWA